MQENMGLQAVFFCRLSPRNNAALGREISLKIISLKIYFRRSRFISRRSRLVYFLLAAPSAFWPSPPPLWGKSPLCERERFCFLSLLGSPL